MLLGRYLTQISEKGRIALPAKFRKNTGNKIVIARWYEDCLVIVGILGWNKLISRFAKEDEVITRPVRSVERYILSLAFEIDTDEQGRFVIPQVLRDEARLKKDVLLLGLGERIELWDKEIWDDEEKKVKEEADKMLNDIAKQRK